MLLPPDLSTRSSAGSRGVALQVSIQALGVRLAFTAVVVLFLAALAMFWITRAQADFWSRGTTLSLPRGLWMSSLLLAGVSASLEFARRSLLVNRQERLRLGLRLGTAFAVAFLLGQALNWRHMASLQAREPSDALFVFSFYLLTVLHALHVVGGFLPLGWVMLRASRREYSSSRAAGVRFCVHYWHLLGLLWLAVLASLYAAAA